MMQKELARLQREDFCYREYPISFAVNVYWLRAVLLLTVGWWLLAAFLLICYGFVFLDVDGGVSGVIGLLELRALQKAFKYKVRLPLHVSTLQVDMGIRNDV